MNHIKIVLIFLIFTTVTRISAQKSAIHTNELTAYNHAIELYQNKAYVAAQHKFNNLKLEFDNSSELKANCEYYAANCAVRLGQPNSDNLMQYFVDKYPTSTKRNSAFIDVADYYFKVGKYAYAAKWYSKVNTTGLTLKKEEAFNFNYAYSLFVTNNYSKAKPLLLNLSDSEEYGAQAKYYYGFIAYKQDDYETADRYLGEIADDSAFKTNISYYLADMNFKLGKFELAIKHATPLLKKARRLEHSEISKIVGESYFNLQKYEEAIPHLKNYKGKRGKWTNTDYYLLGYAYYKKGEFEKATGNFNKIISGSNGVAQNAYYQLAECYLKLEQKPAALNAFKNAAEMKFEPEIKKDAWLNYAKLSYEIGNPYKSVPEVLQEYIDLYPKSIHKNEINDLIISAYISSKDYEGALNYLKKPKTEKERALYQQVTFYYGVGLFNVGNYDLAKENYKNALRYPIDANINAKTKFWLAETNYRLNNFIDAYNGFNNFTADSEASNTAEFQHIDYNIAYSLLKQKKYSQATNAFNKYLRKNRDDLIRENDSYLRIGDGYFITRKYTEAIKFYDKALEINGIESDYTHFQKAISYGLVGNENQKIEILNSFINRALKSKYNDDAHYVLGNSYIKTGENELALENYDRLINNYKRSSLVSKALLKKGIIHYNSDENERALSIYKDVVAKFPNTLEAKQAIKSARQIYVDLGRVDEYASWVKNIKFVNVSNAELDNDTYEAGEKQYLQNNHAKSITNFKKYLRAFPNGLHALYANFYLAQSLFSTNKHNETIPYYTFVTNQQSNEFTESALARLSLVHLESENWDTAIPLLLKLETDAELPQNISFAKSNLMKGFYEGEDYSKAAAYAEKVLQNSKLEARIKSDAHVIIARSAIKTNNQNKAREAYMEVDKYARGELKAEALYYNAFFENQDGSYRVSNQIVQKIASDYAAYKYWAAKGLLLMAKNHYNLDDAYQATYILESVIKNFTQFKDVVDEAKIELNIMKKEEAKTNESVIPNN